MHRVHMGSHEWGSGVSVWVFDTGVGTCMDGCVYECMLVCVWVCRCSCASVRLACVAGGVRGVETSVAVLTWTMFAALAFLVM